MSAQDHIPASRDAFAPPYELADDPHQGIGLARMALWILILIPLAERFPKIADHLTRKRKPRK
jgi:hypothetical protein